MEFLAEQKFGDPKRQESESDKMKTFLNPLHIRQTDAEMTFVQPLPQDIMQQKWRLPDLDGGSASLLLSKYRKSQGPSFLSRPFVFSAILFLQSRVSGIQKTWMPF